MHAIKSTCQWRRDDICFLLNGSMVYGVDRTNAGAGRFMFRIGKNNAAIGKLHGGVVVTMGERSMPGFYFVDEAGCTEKNFKAWLGAAKAYVESLPSNEVAGAGFVVLRLRSRLNGNA